MKALVTGGAGFIGSNVARELLDNNWKVRVFDNLTTGSKENIEGLDVEFIEGDINDKEAINDATKGIDVIFHLAASVGRQRSIDNPQLDAEINLIGTINVLEALRKNAVKKIVYSSSAAIFGELITTHIDEQHPQNADTPYGVSKLAAEKMILAYSDIYNISAICLRYFNIYGINQRFDVYGNVIPIFAKRIYAGEDLTIYGDGKQTRDFLNVKDVAKANFLAATSDIKKGVYNLGCGDSITINELSDMMLDGSGKKVNIIHTEERAGDVRHCKANISHVEKELKFRTSIDLREGLKEYLEWFEMNCIK